MQKYMYFAYRFIYVLLSYVSLPSPGSSDPKLSSRLSQVYTQLEAIEADKAPARYIEKKDGHRHDIPKECYSRLCADFNIAYWGVYTAGTIDGCSFYDGVDIIIMIIMYLILYLSELLLLTHIQ